MKEEARELIKHRLAGAREALGEAGMLCDAGHDGTAAVRLYYSCFYSATALLLAYGESTLRHDLARMLFNSRFVAGGLVRREHGELFSELAAIRQDVENDDFCVIGIDRVRDYLQPVEFFVADLEALVHQAQ